MVRSRLTYVRRAARRMPQLALLATAAAAAFIVAPGYEAGLSEIESVLHEEIAGGEATLCDSRLRARASFRRSWVDGMIDRQSSIGLFSLPSQVNDVASSVPAGWAVPLRC